MAMEEWSFTCDLCGRKVDDRDGGSSLDMSGGKGAATLVMHRSCAIKVAVAVYEARTTGAATLVKP